MVHSLVVQTLEFPVIARRKQALCRLLQILPQDYFILKKAAQTRGVSGQGCLFSCLVEQPGSLHNLYFFSEQAAAAAFWKNVRVWRGEGLKSEVCHHERSP